MLNKKGIGNRFMYNNKNILRVYFDCETTSLLDDAKLISIGLITDNNDIFYAELNDYNYRLNTEPYNAFQKDDVAIDEWTNKHIIPNLLFRDYYYDNTKCNGDKIQIYKANSVSISELLTVWLDKINSDNKTICFYGDNICHTWKFLFNLISQNNRPNIINSPIDLFSSFVVNNVSLLVDRLQYVSFHSLLDCKLYFDDIKLIHRMLRGEELPSDRPISDFKHNALFDALTIKHCFKCLLNE